MSPWDGGGILLGYCALFDEGELSQKADQALSMLESCELCPRKCGADRLSDDASGVCGVGRFAPVASFSLHHGEESPLVGHGGSGTIFFGGCNLKCVFCQNDDISRRPDRAPVATAEGLAEIMVNLQGRGAENINLVTPTHVVPQILEALPIAINAGLSVPLVYNTASYDDVETLLLLDGVVDIYMPDAKFSSPKRASRYCRASDYPDVAMDAVTEMFRQVGDLVVDDEGVASRGLLVRHLVMPNHVAGSATWLDFIAEKISKNTYLNIMSQYRPCGVAAAHCWEYPEIDRAPSPEEVEDVVAAAKDRGLERLDSRRSSARDLFRFILENME